MSEETKELQNNDAPMSSAEFEAKLTEFFTQHKESKLKLVHRIAEEFKGHESEVLEHLHNKYVLGKVTKKLKKKHTAAEGHSASVVSLKADEQINVQEVETKPKSKKKIIIIVIAVVIVALGVVGFFMKDKFLGKHEEPAKTEAAPAEGGAAAEESKPESAPAEPAKVDSVPSATTDSANISSDTAKTE